MIKKRNVDVEGKLDAIKNIRNSMSDLMKKSIHGELGKIKEVKVASNDNAGLKAGLEKAKAMLNKSPESSEEIPGEEKSDSSGLEAMLAGHDESAEPMEEEKSESSEAEHEEVILEDMTSPEKIDELIKKLQDKKEELLQNK